MSTNIFSFDHGHDMHGSEVLLHSALSIADSSADQLTRSSQRRSNKRNASRFNRTISIKLMLIRVDYNSTPILVNRTPLRSTWRRISENSKADLTASPRRLHHQHTQHPNAPVPNPEQEERKDIYNHALANKIPPQPGLRSRRLPSTHNLRLKERPFLLRLASRGHRLAGRPPEPLNTRARGETARVQGSLC